MLDALAAATALAVLTASCSGVVDVPPPASAVINSAWPGCVKAGAFAERLDASGPPGTGSVPADFEPRTAVLCSRGDRTTADGETVLVDLQRTSSEIQPLLEYLSRPSQRFAAGRDGPCQAMGWFPPWLVLVDGAGRWIAPKVPTDACGFALGLFDEGGPVYDRLTYRDEVVGR